MKKINNFFRFFSIWLLFPSAFIGFSSSAAAQTSFRCITDGYNTTILSGETPVLSYDSNSVNASCEFIANRFSAEVNGEDSSSLLLSNGYIKRQAVICIVKRETLPCKAWNKIIDVPEGQDPEEFLFNLLNIKAQAFSRGSSDDQTNKRGFVKFGEAIRKLPR